jgi:phosphoribosyl 1,2-cyclic phosphate phosphodiesterase
METEGLISEGGRAFATHIAHEGNPAHAALVQFATTHRYEIAYDGLTLTV